MAMSAEGDCQLGVCPQIWLRHPPASLPSTIESITAPGSAPFHLKAVIQEQGDDRKTEVELSWNSPQQYRRTIKGDDFSQTLIVNGDRVFEKNSDDYVPVWLHTLAQALTDLTSVKDMLNVKTYGHTLLINNIKDFNGKKVPHKLGYVVDCSDVYSAEISELKNSTFDEKTFESQEETPANERILAVPLRPSDLIAESTPLDVIWPQTLDGAETGEAWFYISTDRTGKVREVTPLKTANERTNDSARRQIGQWKMRPILRDGIPVQAEGTIRLRLNTRIFGPADPLSNEEARKLLVDAPAPEFPKGKVPPGSTFNCRVAVDNDGKVLEMIVGEGSVRGMIAPCLSVSKWRFKPIIQDGRPVSYRALITVTAP